LKSCNRYTAAPLVINQVQLNLAKKTFHASVEEHKQEKVNTKSKIADVYEAKNKMWFKL